jgi:periplasmic protein TonB
MATSAKPARAPETPASAQQPDILPTLFGTTGLYDVRPVNFVYSLALHGVAAALLLTSSLWIVNNPEKVKETLSTFTDISPIILPPADTQAGGGGGGGDRDKLETPKGAAPKFANEQFTPPQVIKRNPDPKLAAEETVIAPPQLQLPQVGQLGDPLTNVIGPPSNGTGTGGGIGTGSGGGLGSGRGPGVGPGWGGGIGGGAYRVGGGVSAPRALYSPEPEYSDEARKVKHQGTVVLFVIVGPDGRPHEMRVSRSLGFGLDEKALEAVKQWRFEPAKKDGRPVAVQINIEVNFRLY